MAINNKKRVSWYLQDEYASVFLAQRLAESLSPSVILTFKGDIGTGKTTIIRAMLMHLGINGPIKSPTFTLVESYKSDPFIIHHFDLYRIYCEEELEYLGFRDYFTSNSVCCIEWAEHAGSMLPYYDVGFELLLKKEGRELVITAISDIGLSILSSLEDKL